MEYKLKAYFTVENSVIIPIFTGIIVALVLLTMTLHDNIIRNSASLQAAMRIEQENKDLEQDNYIENLKEYISTKSIKKAVKDDISKIVDDVKLPDNNPRDFIRKYRGLKNLIQ